jgi:hypothetical protein
MPVTGTGLGEGGGRRRAASQIRAISPERIATPAPSQSLLKHHPTTLPPRCRCRVRHVTSAVSLPPLRA